MTRSVGPPHATKASHDTGESTANAYVQLAAELRACMAFEPKQWTRVMAQSTTLLGHDARGRVAAAAPVTRVTRRLPTRDSGGFTSVPQDALSAEGGAGGVGKRPRSREEDSDVEDVAVDETRHVTLPRIASAHAVRRNIATKRSLATPLPTPTLAQYLNQPHLVDQILQELAHDASERDRSEERSDQGDQAVMEAEDEIAPDDQHDAPAPADDLQCDAQQRSLDATGNVHVRPSVVLPTLSIVSPRTRDGLARLPALTAEELRAIDELERLADTGARRQSLYAALQQFGHERNAPTRGFRHRKMATKIDAVQQATNVRVANQRALQSPWTKRNALSDHARELHLQRAETIQMALEDINAQHLQISPRARFGHHAKYPQGFTLPHGLPSVVRAKLERDHQQLVHVQQVTATDVGIAEARLDQTLQEIKQWIPLEVFYEFGLGKFASPAQQRAVDLLFRVGQRLKNNLVVQAMQQWKLVVANEKRAAIMRSTLVVQCWWRQVLALRQLKSRRRIRREIERRQRQLLVLMASQENKSACTITRAIRRCGVVLTRERAERRTRAARQIQKFWRHQQAAWIALRHHMRQERRRLAAITVQRIVRGFFARRFRRLLTRIKRVEVNIVRRELERVARSQERHRLGAVLVIQRAFRAWVQRRIAVLRSRRARFERDKAKILMVQAYYRGRCGRRWVKNHRQQFQRAVSTIQCAWRCYLARQAASQKQRDRLDQRKADAVAFAERQARRKAKVLPLPVNLNKAAWGGFAAKVAPVISGKKDGGPSPKEIAAATRLQAIWHGMKLRRRLKREHARELEMARRHINRQRRDAATCIQRRVRGIQGRRKAWWMMVHRSASIIQGAWRGFTTRRELFRMRAALKALMKMQCRWRARRKLEVQGQRNAAARRIQRGWRRWMGKTWLYKAVRRQQYLAEEHAMGIALIKLTRKRVNDDLLVQSFIHHDVQIRKHPHEAAVADDDSDDIKSVQRSIYKFDSTKKLWKRRGYDGVWQELYRDISGNSFDIDNSRFARFLKAMPRGFINQRNFPLQTIDLIFAKMKEPKGRTITFPRFNKAMAMVLQEKFAPAPTKQAPPADQPAPTALSSSASTKQQEQEHFLRFMHDFVLPSTLNDGKYRKLLDETCTERLEWAANLLRRFANRIAGYDRHHKFVVMYRKHKLEQARVHAARVLQRHYRIYKFRSTLKETLAHMFIEYVDYKGRSVRFEHIETKRVISATNRRPAFLRGVLCLRMIPLPFPGEEFHAFCERHESATDPYKKVPATVYCVECEDPMCTTCFARDHDKRAAFQAHDQHVISLCSHCHVETATRECLQCGDGKVPFCDVCFPFVHTKLALHKSNDATSETADIKDQHRYRRLVVACTECEEKVAQWMCDVCDDVFCKRCLSKFHAKGQRQSHACHRLSYFSVLKQKAETKRHSEAQKLHDQKRRERGARRAEEERVRKLRETSATTIQSWARSYQARQRGKAYMKLVRQTNAAKAQRLKDERKRSSIGYKIKSVFGLQPSLKSDTHEETEARRQRIESIKQTLFFYRRDGDDEDDEGVSTKSTPGGAKAKTKGGKRSTKKKKRWTKRARAAVEKAATTWLVYGIQVKIVRGTEWKDAVGSVLSTQNLFTTGHVLVFIPLANRSVVVKWEDITPYDEDEILRQPYVPPSQVATDAAMNFRAKVSRYVDAAARRAKLMYLQSIEFHDVVQYAWVVEYNKIEEKEEYWNVVLNKRIFNAPKAMMLLERMEGEDRDRVEARVALAKSKLLQLLNPFQPLDKPRLVFRRHAVVAIPASLKTIDTDVYNRLRLEADALGCARFWMDVIVPDTKFGGKHAMRFLAACSVAPRTTQDCWNMMKLLRWIELQDSDTFTATAKTFFKKSPEIQVYIVNELGDSIGKNEFKEAQTNFDRLLKLKEETIQLLISKADQEAAAAEDKDKT